MIKTIFIIFIVYNVYCFLLMCYDKWQATKNGWRIAELTLLLHAFFFGSLGILIGIYSPLKHKRNDWKFAIGVPIIMIAESVAVLWLFKWLAEKIFHLFS